MQVYSRLISQAESHPEWVVHRDEDWCCDPLGSARRLFCRLGLPFTTRVEAWVLKSSSECALVLWKPSAWQTSATYYVMFVVWMRWFQTTRV